MRHHRPNPRRMSFEVPGVLLTMKMCLQNETLMTLMRHSLAWSHQKVQPGLTSALHQKIC